MTLSLALQSCDFSRKTEQRLLPPGVVEDVVFENAALKQNPDLGAKLVFGNIAAAVVYRWLHLQRLPIRSSSRWEYLKSQLTQHCLHFDGQHQAHAKSTLCFLLDHRQLFLLAFLSPQLYFLLSFVNRESHSP